MKPAVKSSPEITTDRSADAWMSIAAMAIVITDDKKISLLFTPDEYPFVKNFLEEIYKRLQDVIVIKKVS